MQQINGEFDAALTTHTVGYESCGLLTGVLTEKSRILVVIGTVSRTAGSTLPLSCEFSHCKRAVTDRGCAALVFDTKRRFTGV
jgi:hypothetical protein